MSGDIHQISYELAGLSTGRTSEAEWRKAIRDGELTRDTIVIVYRESEEPASGPAGAVPELRPLFEEAEARPEDPAPSSADAGNPPSSTLAEAGLWLERPSPGVRLRSESGTGSPAPTQGEGQSRRSRRRKRHASATDWIEREPHSADKHKGQDLPIEGCRTRAVLTALVCAALLAAGAVWLVWQRLFPEPGVDWRSQTYRVTTPAHLYKMVRNERKWVKTLERDELVEATQDGKSGGSWLVVAEGNDAGFFVSSENLEPVNTPGEDVASVK